MPLDYIQLLRELVRIPSVNPMGRDVTGDIYLEEGVTNHLENVFRDLGLNSERHTVVAGRDNLLVSLDDDASNGRPILLLEAHQDTVPVDGMTIDPWGAELANGRIHGRGACDIKGGLSCIVGAASRLVEEHMQMPWRLVMAFTVNEEYGYSGAAHLRECWKNGSSAILPRQPNAIVVAEPTELNVVVAHKGVMRWRCHTQGQAAHSSDPANGVNAIYRMSRVISAVEQYAEQLVIEPPHALAGPPTANIGLIRGGVSVNTVPDSCSIELERRLLPGESPDDAYESMVSFINRDFEPEQRPLHDRPYMASAGLPDKRNGSLAESMQRTVEELDIPCRRMGVPYGTDASELARDGIPTIVFGPGSILQAHTADEWVAVEQLDLAVRILCQFARKPVGQSLTRITGDSGC